VVLGDRYGGSCDVRLTRRLRSLFEGLGWRVGLNQPYAGGYSTQTWGRPDEGYHAIQIELNRALYLDETTLEPSADFERCRKAIQRVIAAVCAQPWNEEA
jgi:N-formylglutamate amidohydrolase